MPRSFPAPAVIPAKAGTHAAWVPAFAGMTCTRPTLGTIISRRPLVLLVLLLPLAACVPGPPPPASQYRQAEVVSRVPLVFVPRSTQLTEAENAQLRSLGQTLPVQAVSTLQASGPLAAGRAQEVAQHLARPVQLVAAAGMPPDQTLLVNSSPAIVADSCRGPGTRELGSIWPSNDDAPSVLLPPGCAMAVDIQAQTTSSHDLLAGRPLPPGAATPFAAAIERYYRRNDQPQSNAAQGGSQGGSQGQADQSGSAGAQGSSANPLLGPLPAEGQSSGQ